MHLCENVSFESIGILPLLANLFSEFINQLTSMEDFWDAWWQQTYQVKSIILGHVRTRRTT